ncbi:putative metalloprotease CJM1_0395 family protein [Azospirillum agricola]|uniref:putative metalloprotease CJM1_0395 family protein n=1 Tax=Azospirillum agricola TaxID=1720247 RepID=UPI000A0F2835|nr:putative metalloprotease CJM1_0395 family protein [Azospirillum agricola]SMH58750.1 SprA-related family protein [Azospirillum lipoferum]
MAGDVSSIGSSIGTYRAPFAAAPARNGGGRTASGDGPAADGAAPRGSQAAASVVTLSAEAQQQVQKLKQTDANVRQHEAAHQAAGGGHAGAASFTHARGPDGKSYAVAGEVPIDISAESEPSATIAKMEQVKAAALAPSDPSPQDLRVAAQADAQKLKARSELGSAGGEAGGNGMAASAPSPALAARGTAAYGAAQALGASPRRAAGLVA